MRKLHHPNLSFQSNSALSCYELALCLADSRQLFLNSQCSPIIDPPYVMLFPNCTESCNVLTNLSSCQIVSYSMLFKNQLKLMKTVVMQSQLNPYLSEVLHYQNFSQYQYQSDLKLLNTNQEASYTGQHTYNILLI